MHDHIAHNLLSQLPLTVSPFINLPAAVTLPYTYTIPPSHLPPSSAPYAITSPSGQSSMSPQELIDRLSALNDHLLSETTKAKEKIAKWEEDIKERELAEKRRVAPGYLDTGVVMLEPKRVSKGKEKVESSGERGRGQVESMSAEDAMAETGVQKKRERGPSLGEELNKAFGGMGL